jgi:DMSO/TMAO reductase YedYZ molybdopterin-dependent catalytic subunit
VQKALLSDRALAKEYRPEDLTSFPRRAPPTPRRARAELADLPPPGGGAFAEWRLPVGGRVAKPQAFTLADLRQFPSRTQITRHTCEEGWSAIGQWTGVPLSAVLDAAGVLPSARFVVFSAYEGWIDSIDMLDASIRRRSWPTG